MIDDDDTFAADAAAAVARPGGPGLGCTRTLARQRDRRCAAPCRPYPGGDFAPPAPELHVSGPKDAASAAGAGIRQHGRPLRLSWHGMSSRRRSTHRRRLGLHIACRGKIPPPAAYPSSIRLLLLAPYTTDPSSCVLGTGLLEALAPSRACPSWISLCKRLRVQTTHGAVLFLLFPHGILVACVRFPASITKPLLPLRFIASSFLSRDIFYLFVPLLLSARRTFGLSD